MRTDRGVPDRRVTGRVAPGRSEVGAGSVLALAIVAATVTIALAAVALGAGLAVRQRTIAAADAAALAAADVLLGAAPGDPCTVAASVAELNGTRLESCELDGWVATVTTSSWVAGTPIVARSTAGPDPAG
jgi:secretion/DNA translocation related TadE-like protein